MRQFRKLSALLVTAAFLFGLGTSPASANSAQTSWSGVNSTGSYITDADCPVVVEHELLTFDAAQFPQNYYRDETAFLDYTGKVTAQYTFYNPADYTVTMRLAFPFGGFPAYGYITYDEALEHGVPSDDTQKFAITVDGKEIDKQLRYTLFASYDQFDPERDLGRLQDGFTDDPFYSPDLPVTHYTFTLSGIDKETWPASDAAIDLPAFDGKTRYFLMELSGWNMNEDGSGRVHVSADNETEIHLYILGDEPDQPLEWRFYQNGATEDGEEIEGTATLTSTEKMIFKDFALSQYNPSGDISESDWYNAIVDMLNENTWEENSFIQLGEIGTNGILSVSSQLMRWYVYELTLEPGQTLVNTVEAPIYPAIDLKDEPSFYNYTYLLSPAQTWADFGNLEIVINTPYELIESTPDKFEKTETGYTLTLDGLPDSELTFCLAEGPRKTSVPPFAIILIAVLVAGMIVAIIIRHRKKKNMSSDQST